MRRGGNKSKGVDAYGFQIILTAVIDLRSAAALQMGFEPRHEIPDFPVYSRHFPHRVRHLTNAGFIHRLDFTETKRAAGLDQAHGLRVQYLAGGIVHRIHAVIELVTDVRAVVEAVDQAIEFLAKRFVLDPDSRQPLDEIEPCPSGIQCRKHDSSRRLIGLQKQHENIDKQAFVVGPVEDQTSDQRQDGGPAIRGSRRCRLKRGEIGFLREVVGGHFGHRA